jgi:hypothetical protein
MKSYLAKLNGLFLKSTVWIDNVKKNTDYHMSFITSFFCYFIVHISFLVHKFVNEDSIYKFKVYDSAGYIAGRWFYDFVVKFHSVYSIPFVSGILCALYIGVLAVFTIDVLKIHNRIMIALSSLLLTAFPTLAYTSGYDYTFDSIVLSLALSAAAVYFTYHFKYGFVFGAILLMFSLAIYQASLGYCIGLFVFILIRLVLDNESSVKKIINTMLRYASSVIIGIFLYFGSVNLFLSLHNTTMHTYKGMDQMGRIPIEMIPNLVSKSIYRFLCFFAPQPKGSFFYVSDFLFKLYVLFFVLFVAFLLFYIFRSRIYKKLWRMMLLVVLLAMVPISLNIIDVVSPYASASTLNIYPVVLIFLFLLSMCEGLQIKSAQMFKFASILVLFLIGYNHLLLSNIYYTKISTYYERTYGLYNRILARIEQMEEIELIRNNQMLIIGALPSFNYGRNVVFSFPEIINDQGLWGQFVGVTSTTGASKAVRFIGSFLGIDFTPATQEQKEKIILSPEYSEMGVWPEKNSVAYIDSTIVINMDYLYPAKATKLSENKCNVSNIIKNVREDYYFIWYIYNDGKLIDSIWSPSLREFEYEIKEPGHYSFGMWIRDENNNNIYYGLSNAIAF